MKIAAFIFSIALAYFAFSAESFSSKKRGAVLTVEESLEYLEDGMTPSAPVVGTVSHIALFRDGVFIFYSGSMPESIAVYNPPDFRADAVGGKANIFSGGFSEMFDPSLYNIAYLAVSPQEAISFIEKAAKENGGWAKIENGALAVSYGQYSYTFSRDSNGITGINITKNATGELFAKVSFSYGSGAEPLKVRADYCHEGKPAICKNYSIKISDGLPYGMEECFDFAKFGPLKCADMRFSPPLYYVYDAGIPSMAEARKSAAENGSDSGKIGSSAFFGEVLRRLKVIAAK